MKKSTYSVLVAVALMLAWAGAAQAQHDGFGLGAMAGEPTGLSAKLWLNDTRALDAAAAWSFSENDSFQFHGDYLFHNFNVFRDVAPADRLPVYFGLGARVKLSESEGNKGQNEEDDLVGIRFPLGLCYLANTVPADLFIEIVPVLDVAPDTEFDLNAAVGARFYF